MLIIGCTPKGRPSARGDGTAFIPLFSNSAADTNPTPTRGATPTSTPTWPSFTAIPDAQVTQVPEQAGRVTLDADIEVFLLLGTDEEAPYIGLTNAFHLVLVNTRFAKASVISIPGNLLVYLPGFGMKRLNAAYALGGFSLVEVMLIYNFGLKPDRIVLTHPTEFKWLVDDLGGVDVSVLTPIRNDCGGLPAGTHRMDGAKTYCYVAYLNRDDEIDRVRRGQQILQLLFNKLVRDGRMAALPMMYASYQEKLESDFDLMDVLSRIPLAMKIGDIGRVNYRLVGWDLVTEWDLPDNSQTKVLLPKPDSIVSLLNDSIHTISQPSPLTEMVLTYEAQLTAVVGVTQTSRYAGTQPPIQQRTPTPTGWFNLTSTPQPIFTRTSTPRPTSVIYPTQPVPTNHPYPILSPTPVSTSDPYPGN